MCLIKSVLNNLPIYYLSIFPVLVTVAAKIEKKIRSKNASYTWSRMVNACARDHENLKNIVDQESCILVGNIWL